MEMQRKQERSSKKSNDSNGGVYIMDVKNGYDDPYEMSFQSKDFIIPTKEKYTKRLEEASAKGQTGGHSTGVEHPTTYVETLMHLFKGNVGSGIFAMGDAFKNSGLAMGPWLVICLGIICVHSQHLLLNASNKIKKQLNMDHQPDFAMTVELSFATGPTGVQRFAPFMRKLINIFLVVTQLGFCCVYFVFVATNLEQVFQSYDIKWDVHIHMAIIFVPILLSCMVRNLKYLTPFSMVANVCMLIGIAIAMYYATQDIPPLSSVNSVATISQFPLFFGTALFAFEGIGLVLPLQSEMKKPKQFDKILGVLNVGMTFVTFLYVMVGFLSYLKYGENIQGSVTLNLPPDEILAQCVKIMICVGMLLTFPLQFYIPIEIMFPKVEEKFGPFKHPVFAELLFRTLFVVIVFTMAEAIPFLDLFITLVGALCSTTIALLFPPILQFVTHWSTSEVTPWMVIKNLFILGIGLLGCVTGSFESIRLIVKAFTDGRT